LGRAQTFVVALDLVDDGHPSIRFGDAANGITPAVPSIHEARGEVGDIANGRSGRNRGLLSLRCGSRFSAAARYPQTYPCCSDRRRAHRGYGYRLYRPREDRGKCPSRPVASSLFLFRLPGGEAGAVLQLQLPEHIGDVVFDAGYGDGQVVGDLGVGFACADEFEDAPFGGGEDVGVRWAASAVEEGSHGAEGTAEEVELPYTAACPCPCPCPCPGPGFRSGWLTRVRRGGMTHPLAAARGTWVGGGRGLLV